MICYLLTVVYVVYVYKRNNILLIFLFLFFSSLIIQAYLIYFINTSIIYVNKFIVSQLKLNCNFVQ